MPAAWARRVAVVAACIVGPVLAPSSAFAELQNLHPGQFAQVDQDVPVTVVLVGLEPGTGATGIDADRMLGSQLAENRVADRTTRFFERNGVEGLEPAAIGLRYRYHYRAVFADDSFEDAFFGYLSSTALGPIPGGTFYQQAYSAHPLAAEHIPASFLVDATAAEHWLAANAGPMLGVDTTRPTVFLINWHGRPDFVFHTYAFLDQRPDIPFPLGLTHEGQMIAWGGSPRDVPYGALGREARVWFYDVSAGPDYSTANWLLEPSDFTGDGETDERIPPIWEYGTTHWYRPFDDLTGDLAALLRFVAVDELFGSSPIYDPALSEPLLADRIELDLNLFAGRPGIDPAGLVRANNLRATLARLDPTRQFAVDAETRPLTGAVGAAYDCQQSAFTAQPRSCFGSRSRFEDLPETSWDDAVFDDLDLYFGSHRNEYLDGIRYEVPLAVFDVPQERLAPGSLGGLASIRSPNIQAWTYAWLADSTRAQLLTATGTISHEVGHHLGLSHVHDTYDPALDADVSSVRNGAFWFLQAGTEAYTGMSYLPNTDEFGQFDRDHIARWQVAVRLDNANRILGDIQRSPRAAAAAATVAAADLKVGDSLAALDAWDLAGASLAAADAYRLVLSAAAQANVKVEPFTGVADQAPGAGVIAGATDPRGLTPPTPPGRSSDAFARYTR